MNIEVAFVFDPHHDQLVDVLHPVDELLVIRRLPAETRLHDLLTIIIIPGHGVKVAGICNAFLDPPAFPVKLGGLEGNGPGIL